MELQIWSKVGEKQGAILALLGDEVHRIGVSGAKARREIPRMIEALHQGQEPSSLGAGKVETMPLASIGAAEVDPDGNNIRFRSEGDGGASLKFTANNSEAQEIARAVLARSGRPFREEKQDLGPVEALIQPLVIGGIVGFFWFLLYKSAEQVAAGEVAEIHGRRQGLKQLFVKVSETLGTGGTTAIGAVLGALIIAWAAMRIVKRPQRTVWTPGN